MLCPNWAQINTKQLMLRCFFVLVFRPHRSFNTFLPLQCTWNKWPTLSGLCRAHWWADELNQVCWNRKNVWLQAKNWLHLRLYWPSPPKKLKKKTAIYLVLMTCMIAKYIFFGESCFYSGFDIDDINNYHSHTVN